MTLFSAPPAFDWPVQFCTTVTAITYILSIITSNVSQVDRLWTFLPTIYCAYFALLPLWPTEQPFFLAPYAPKSLGYTTVRTYSPRALLMLAIITLWMFRLSYNTYRRGLFNLKDEDYRWVVLRTKIPAWFFHITNLTFIAAIQNILLLFLSIPTFTATVLQPHTDLATSDYILALAALSILLFEFTADNQQYSFQTYKYAFLAHEKGEKPVQPYKEKNQWLGARLAWTPSDARRGFVTKGLWRFSRHPNFACEQSFWWLITLYPLLAPSPPNLPPLPSSEDILNLETLLNFLKPTALLLFPALSLSILFFSSTAFTEDITKEKYPIPYAAYQKRVGMFFPFKALVTGLLGGKDKDHTDKLIWGEYDYTREKVSKAD